MIEACTAAGQSAKGDRLERMQASPRYKNNQFANSLPTNQPNFFKALAKWSKGNKFSKPEQSIPTVELSKSDFEKPPITGLRITWLGHSTSLIEIDGSRVLLDPIWSEHVSPVSWMGPKRFFAPPLAIADLPELDAVLISHDHYDHLDKKTVIELAKTGVLFIVPLGVGTHLEYWDIPKEQITELDWWENHRINNLTIHGTPARHFSGRSMVMTDRDKTLWAGFAIQGPKHRVYYSGDTAMFEGLKEIGERLGPFDAALLEVGAYNEMWADLHLGPEQAVDALRMVRASLLIPVHWATFDLALHGWTEPAERLIQSTQHNPKQLVLPLAGQSFEPAHPPKITRWWPETPWQTAKEQPVISSSLNQP